jgi:4-carboxymuconolactone decarboxylase
MLALRIPAIALAVLLPGCATMSDAPKDRLADGPRRFALTPLTEMTPEQLAVAKAIMTGPRASVGSPAAAAGATSLSSPFNVWNRRPELADNLQKVGEYIRFRSSLPARLTNMKEDERIVYDFTRELHERHGVSDATFKRAVDAFDEQGVADLIAVNGYYVLVSMTLNVDRTPIPGGGKPPLD